MVDDKDADDRRFQALLQEYAKLRGEALERVRIQESAVRQALCLTVGAAVALVALYNIHQDHTAASEDGSFTWLAAAVVSLHGLFVVSLYFNWLYQLGFLFRISAYLYSLRPGPLRKLVKDTRGVFEWGSGPAFRAADLWERRRFPGLLLRASSECHLSSFERSCPSGKAARPKETALAGPFVQAAGSWPPADAASGWGRCQRAEGGGPRRGHGGGS